MVLRHRLCWLFAILISPALLAAQTDDLLTRIWAGEQQAQAKFTTACGTVTEIRTSKLMVKPLVLHGKFCAEGTDRFMLEYFEPNPMLIRLNESHFNIKIDGGKAQAMDIGSDIHRVQSSFTGPNSIENLKKDYTITTQENSLDYEMKLIPSSGALRHRFNYLVVKLNKKDFLPRSLEVDGKSGVNSVFTFDITSRNIKLPEDTFEVLKTK
jgi:outer membrane lipoprotein-sorting protein